MDAQNEDAFICHMGELASQEAGATAHARAVKKAIKILAEYQMTGPDAIRDATTHVECSQNPQNGQRQRTDASQEKIRSVFVRV